MRGWRARARSSTRSSAPASRARRASRRPPRSRRSTAAARRSSPATSPPGSTPRAARSRARRSRPTSPSASTPPSSATGSRPASGAPGELRVAPIGIPDGRARRARARATIDAAVLDAGAAPRARARPSSAPGRWRSPAARAGLTGAVRMSSLAAIRAGAGYATVAVPADLEPIFEAGPARGDVGRLPRRRRLPGAGLAEGGAAGLRARRRGRARPRPGPRPRLGRAGPRGRRARSRRRW